MYKLIAVDDEKFIRESLVFFEWETIDVQPMGSFESGAAALDYLSKNPVDVVLTDIRMPGMDGISLIAQIKEINSRIAVICISGYSDYEYLRACLQVGADDYLLKPIDKDELFKAVRHLTVGTKNIRAEVPSESTSGESSRVQHHYINIVLKYVDEHYQQPISLERVAEVVGLNPVYLSYLFKKVKQVKFSEYINEVRLTKAEELLVNSTYKIGEIAEQVGYNDARYFSSLFKKRTGMSPNDYRNNQGNIQ